MQVNMVIPNFYRKGDIHLYFALYNLESEESAPKHGYS